MIRFIFKIYRKIKNYRIRLERYLQINEYKHLDNNRIIIKSNYLFDRDFHIELDSSSASVYIGKNVLFREGGRITCLEGGKVEIKDGVFFNRNCSINCLSYVEIGKNCLLGEGVKIYDHNHNYRNPDRLIKDQGYKRSPVIIGENTWIGSNTIILKGVYIGDNVVIGANNLIIKDIQSNSVIKSCTVNLIEPIQEPENKNRFNQKSLNKAVRRVSHNSIRRNTFI